METPETTEEKQTEAETAETKTDPAGGSLYRCSCGVQTGDPSTFDTRAQPCSVAGFHAWKLNAAEPAGDLSWTPCGLDRPHGRHQLGVAGGTCPGVAEPVEQSDDLGTYVAMFDQYRAEQKHWLGGAQLPLVFHIRKLCAKLDADPDAPASLSSAYLQALHRLERQRPGAKEPAGAAGDLPGQGSIFDELD